MLRWSSAQAGEHAVDWDQVRARAKGRETHQSEELHRQSSATIASTGAPYGCGRLRGRDTFRRFCDRRSSIAERIDPGAHVAKRPDAGADAEPSTSTPVFVDERGQMLQFNNLADNFRDQLRAAGITRELLYKNSA
jgi:hypothetical protein